MALVAAFRFTEKREETGRRVKAAKWQSALAQWTQQLMIRRPSNVVACALVNKLAWIVWAVLVKGEEYRPAPNAA